MMQDSLKKGFFKWKKDNEFASYRREGTKESDVILHLSLKEKDSEEGQRE